MLTQDAQDIKRLQWICVAVAILSVILMTCTMAGAADPKLPAIFQELEEGKAQPVKVGAKGEQPEGNTPEEVFGEGGDPDDIDKLKEAVSYLYLTKTDEKQVREIVKEELARLNLSVRNTQGQTREVTVPVGSDWRGAIHLNPGEKLVGYQDPLTGRWVNLGQPQVQRLPQGQPVDVYQTDLMQIRSTPSAAGIEVNPGVGRQWMQGIGVGQCVGGVCRR